MPRFTVRCYSTMTSGRREIVVPTLSPDPSLPQLGYIHAPQGAEAYQPRGRGVKLKVPKPGRPGEFWVHNAQQAVTEAKEGNDGLSWESAAPAPAVIPSV